MNTKIPSEVAGLPSPRVLEVEALQADAALEVADDDAFAVTLPVFAADAPLALDLADLRRRIAADGGVD